MSDFTGFLTTAIEKQTSSAAGSGEKPELTDTAVLPTFVKDLFLQFSVPSSLRPFVEKLGVTERTKVKTLLCMAEDDLTNALDKLEEEGVIDTPLARAELIEVTRDIFLASGLPGPGLGAVAAAPVRKEAASFPDFPPAPLPVGDLRAPDLLRGDVALQDVVDQTLKVNAKALSFSELADYRATYERLAGAPPPEEHLPSAEQLAALRGLISMGKTPYVDFGVFCAYGSRLSRFRKVEAAVWVNGSFVTKPLEGPSSYEAWCSSWALFSVALVSLGEASVGTLTLYAAGISKLVKLYPSRWSVILTTDIVVRSERWTYLREMYERHRPAEFNPKQPWDAVIAASAFGYPFSPMAAWWNTNFVLPNTLANSAAGAFSMIRSVEGMPSGSSASSSGTSAALVLRSRSRSRGRKNKKNKKSEKDKKDDQPITIYKTKAQNMDKMCKNWNYKRGACATGKGKCRFNRTHACCICGQDHRAIDFHGPADEDDKKKR